MMSSYLLLFTIMVSSTQAVNVEFAHNSQRGGLDIYLRDTLTLTCTSTGGVGITSIGFELSQQSANCIWNGHQREWALTAQISSFPLANVSAGCNSLGVPTADSHFTYTVSGTITEDFRTYIGSALYCYSFGDAFSTNSSTSLAIRDLKVPPENLSITINRKPVIEGEPFTLLCNSSSNSGSVYKYETSRDGNKTWSEITGSPPTYNSTRADRGGLLVRCTDTAHTKWTGGNTVEVKWVLPNYLEAPIASQQVLILNPTVDNSLTCNVYSRPEPVYSWTRTIGSETLESVRTVTLPRDETRRDGEWEEVVCTATVSGTSLNATMTWQITWDRAAPTPATPPTTTTKKTPPSPHLRYWAFIIVLPGGGGVGIFVFIFRKKVKAANSESEVEMAPGDGRGKSTNGKNKLVKQSDSRKAKKEKSDLKLKSPPQRYKDDPIVYTEVEFSHKRTRTDRRPDEYPAANKLPPKPADSVVYSSIDPMQTKAYKERNGQKDHQVKEPTDDGTRGPNKVMLPPITSQPQSMPRRQPPASPATGPTPPAPARSHSGHRKPRPPPPQGPPPPTQETARAPSPVDFVENDLYGSRSG